MKYFALFFFSFLSFKSYSQQSPDSSKSGYNLFHPTPKKLMRGFETDRPDATESAYTLDAGHFQLETDLFKTERYNFKQVKTINNYINTANFKIGITNSTDFQIVIATLNNSKIITCNSVYKQKEFGGFTFRIKQNLWGNDNGKTAFSILPFVSVPVTTGTKLSGGIVFPFALQLLRGWDFGAQIETDIIPNQKGNKYRSDFLASATTSHSLCKNLDFFVEGVALKNNEIKKFEYFIDGGLVYSLTRNLNIDTGVYYGIKNISSKTFFIGMSFRI